jgi:hypothetical protein
MAFEPLKGWREVEVSEHRRGPEYTHLTRHLVDELYPDAEKIRLVCDNLSTHTAAAFYEAFPPEVARSLTKRIEFCYTPVHGSWLNMVEVEISVLVRPCLRRCIPAIETLRREVKAWQRSAMGLVERKLSFHHRRCAHQTPHPLPFRKSVTEG